MGFSNKIFVIWLPGQLERSVREGFERGWGRVGEGLGKGCGGGSGRYWVGKGGEGLGRAWISILQKPTLKKNR